MALQHTSAFTPPTESATAVTNTKATNLQLTLYQSDGSSSSHTITINGDTSTKPFAPFDGQEYSASSHLGSAHFDGTGDVLTVANHADLSMGTGDFTIEMWVYPTTSNSGQSLITKEAILLILLTYLCYMALLLSFFQVQMEAVMILQIKM